MKTGTAQPMLWVGGWQNLDAQEVIKRRFRVYLTVDCPQEVSIRITMETENRARTKTLAFRPGARQRCVPFQLYGRRFRLLVESDGTAPWQLLGGVQIDMDTEE